MRSLATLVFLAAISGPAAAQDGLLWTPELLTVSRQDDEANLYFLAYGRVSDMRGEAISGVFDYNQVFDFGGGAGLEVGYLWGVDSRYGLFLSFQGDMFIGDEATDAVGDKIEPDNMMIGAVLFGVKGDGMLTDWLRYEGRIAIGGAVYNTVDADLTVGGVSTDIELFERSGALALEGGIRVFWGGLSLGFGMRFTGPPEEGSDFQASQDPEALVMYYGEFGLSFGF